MRKISLYIDEELWAKFKDTVLRKHGTLRKLSNEVENLLRETLVDEEVRQALKRINANIKTLKSPEEIKRERPTLRGPAAELLIREMRGNPIAKGLS
ncbi:MAG: hypothetical protein QW702_03175 [Candidatus Bathyarchaeia archaeon]